MVLFATISACQVILSGTGSFFEIRIFAARQKTPDHKNCERVSGCLRTSALSPATSAGTGLSLQIRLPCLIQILKPVQFPASREQLCSPYPGQVGSSFN